MPMFKGSRRSNLNYPEVNIEKSGTYVMQLARVMDLGQDSMKCGRCSGRGSKDGEECRKCSGTGTDTFDKLRFRWEAGPFVAEEDMRKSISEAWVNKAGETVSASTLYNRLSMLSGISDPDLLEDVDEKKLYGSSAEITIGWNKTRKYLRITGVEALGTCINPITADQIAGMAVSGLRPVSAVPNGLQKPPTARSEATPSPELPGFAQSVAPKQVEAPSTKDCYHAFVMTGRDSSQWGAFLASHGFGGWTPEHAKAIDENPNARLKLMADVRGLKELPGEDINDLVPF